MSKDPEWEDGKVATYDNPSTQCRECWCNGSLIASYKMPLLVAQGCWPPPAKLFFFGANIGPWKEGQIVGDAAAIRRGDD